MKKNYAIFNANNAVIVTITDAGIEYLKKYCVEKLGIKASDLPNIGIILDGHLLKAPLHDIMSIFGQVKHYNYINMNMLITASDLKF